MEGSSPYYYGNSPSLQLQYSGIDYNNLFNNQQYQQSPVYGTPYTDVYSGRGMSGLHPASLDSTPLPPKRPCLELPSPSPTPSPSWGGWTENPGTPCALCAMLKLPAQTRYTTMAECQAHAAQHASLAMPDPLPLCFPSMMPLLPPSPAVSPPIPPQSPFPSSYAANPTPQTTRSPPTVAIELPQITQTPPTLSPLRAASRAEPNPSLRTTTQSDADSSTNTTLSQTAASV